VIHAASIASPTYYRKFPIETMDANVNGLRSLLEYALAQKDGGKPLEAFLFYSTSEIYGDPTPENIPTPETYRGNVSCTGPARLLRREQALRRDALRQLRPGPRPADQDRPAVQQLRPGLKITDRRVLPDFAQRRAAGRDIVMLSDGAPPGPSATSPTRSSATTRSSSAAGRARPTTSAPRTPEISMATLADKVVGIPTRLFGYEGRVVRRSARTRPTSSTTPTAAARHRQGARGTRLRTRRSGSTRA
jgi:UDP-glucuronate decarboxylase